MKKIVIVTISFLAVILAVFGVYYLILRKPAAEAPSQKSEALYISGKVLIKRKDAVEWEKAVRDMPVKDGDTIATSDKSTVEIKFGEKQKNYIAAKDNTTVTVEKITKKGNKRLLLEKGGILSHIEDLDPDSKFEIRTPTATCGVVGTGFETKTDKDLTTLKVYRGQAYAKSRGITGVLAVQKNIQEGTMVHIGKNKAPTEPIPVSAEDLENFQKWVGELDSHLFRILYVFLDEGYSDNRYHPSGWVGDYDAIRRVSWEENPYSGKNCLKFVYTGRTPQGAGWAGVYWQNPVNNWGDVKGGYNLKGAKRVIFWAKGENGGETITRFGIGGIGGQYPDSSKAEIGPVVLEKDWKQYSIDLANKDISYISGGFYWMTDKVSNPDGAIFYLDEIKYE